jgi:Zn-dependent M28 family amino/carboxypeptidase
MEAARIIAALNLKPRRTIRIALWSGEEQGLYGSKAYVTEHFGFFTNETRAVTLASSNRKAPHDKLQPANELAPDSLSPSDAERARERGARSQSTNNEPRKLVRGPEYDKLSIYFNLDNGAGKIRGVYLQGNEALRPIFRRWLEPFRDMGAETLSLANTGSTDHMSFDTIGLPGLEFLQDPLDYMTRTHHSNEDVFDRIQGDDLKQAATIIAAFVYDAAMADEKMPRKPLVENPPRRARPAFD